MYIYIYMKWFSWSVPLVGRWLGKSRRYSFHHRPGNLTPVSVGSDSSLARDNAALSPIWARPA